MPLYSFFIITVTTEVVINVTIKVIIYLGLLCSVAAVVFFAREKVSRWLLAGTGSIGNVDLLQRSKWTSELYFVLTGTCLGKLTTADRPREWGRHNFMAISDRIVFLHSTFFQHFSFCKVSQHREKDSIFMVLCKTGWVTGLMQRPFFSPQWVIFHR